jgi:hypothetical protein
MKLVTPAKAGVQNGGPLDSGFRRNDEVQGPEMFHGFVSRFTLKALKESALAVRRFGA